MHGQPRLVFAEFEMEQIMGAIKKLERSPLGFMTAGMRCVAAILVVLTLAVTVLLAGVASSASEAYAAIYPVTETEQAADAGTDAAAAEVQIDDEANPMSSGLEEVAGSSEAGVPLYAFTAVGIAVVAVFFVVSTRKLNNSISAMNRSVR